MLLIQLENSQFNTLNIFAISKNEDYTFSYAFLIQSNKFFYLCTICNNINKNVLFLGYEIFPTTIHYLFYCML